MVQIEEPGLRPRDVLVDVCASTINIDDIHVAEGTFFGGLPIGPRPSLDRPVIPGSDVAGVVAAVGKDVRGFHRGQAVFGVQVPLRRGGAWAEFCAIDERWLTKKPENLSFETAAASGVSGLVAHSAIKALNVSPGKRIVIVGVTGGIGSMAAQTALRAGTDVTGVCGPRNVDRAYQLGCSNVVDYSQGPWDTALRSHGEGLFDGVLDCAGGTPIERMALQVLKRDGEFVTVVGPEQFIGDRQLSSAGILALMVRIGYRMLRSMIVGPRYVLTGPGPGAGAALADVASAASEGILPEIDSIVPFEIDPVREALREAVAHRNHGRIVIDVNCSNH